MEFMHDSTSIVGGGPAGCSTGIFLSKAGFDNVKIYEKSTNQRKPCGGILTWRFVREYENLIKGVEMNKIREIKIDFNGVKFALSSKTPMVNVIDRLEMDKHLRSVAENEGVDLIRKRVNPEDLNDRTVVDARGVDFKKSLGIARVSLCRKKNSGFNYIINNSLISKGYFWIFPLNDRIVNVGCGGELKELKVSINRLFDLFVKKINAKPFVNMGYCMGYYGKINRLTEKSNDKSIFKVGDSAGLVNPASGEGIYQAMRSSEILSDCLKFGEEKLYESRIKKEFGTNLLISKFLVEMNTIKMLPKFLKLKILIYLIKKVFPSAKIESIQPNR